MGDTKLLLSTQSEPCKHYRADSGALKFQAKSRSGSASLFLLSKSSPHPKCLYEVHLSRTSIIIDCENHERSSKETPQVSLAEFREYWITWFGNKIRLGIADNPRPILVFAPTGPLGLIGFITFNTRMNHSHSIIPVEWKVEVGPRLKVPKCRMVDGAPPVWRPFRQGDALPPDAFIGGMERGEPTYVARAPHEGSVTPGKYLRSEDAAFLGWSLIEHRKVEFEVLCGYNMTWVPGVYHAPPPAGALVAGVSQNENRDQLYSIRVPYNGDIVLGKQHDSHGNCFIPYNSAEIDITSYFEILVVPPGPSVYHT